MQIKSDVNDQVFGRLEKEPEHRIYHEVRHMRFHYYQMWCPLKDQVERPVWRQTKRQVHDQMQDQLRQDVRAFYTCSDPK